MTAPVATQVVAATNSDTDSNGIFSASVTIEATARVLILTVTRKSTGNTERPVVSGDSIASVTLVDESIANGGGVDQRLTLWQAEGTGSPGTIIMSTTAQMWGFGLQVTKYLHDDGMPEIVANKIAGPVDTDFTSTLGPFNLPSALQTDSRVFAAFAACSGVTFTSPLSQAVGSSPGGAIAAYDGASASPSATINYGEKGTCVAVEIGVPGGDPSEGGGFPNDAHHIETIDLETGDLSQFDSTYNTPQAISGAAKNGGFGLRVSGRGSGDSDAVTTSQNAYSAGCLIGAWVRFQTVGPAARFAFMYPRDGGDPPCDLGMATDGKLSLVDDAALNENKSADALTAGQWYRIELYWDRAGRVIVRVDEEDVIDVSSFDTVVASPGVIDYQMACWDQPSVGPYVDFDDIQIYDGATPDDHIFGVGGSPGAGTVHKWLGAAMNARRNGGI